jgi:O-antigen ligase
LLKRSFVYSCGIIIVFCLMVAAYYYFLQGTPSNFDIRTNENFRSIHPNASSVWMHFSYIQLAQWAGLHPIYFSMYLVFCLTILFTENYSGRAAKITHFTIASVIVCFLALLASRIAIVAFASSAIYLSICKIQEHRIKDVVPIAFISFVVGLFLWLNPVARFRVIEEPMITTYQADQSVTNWNSVSYRLLEWKGSWSIIQSNWLTGVGTGASKKSMDNFYAHYNSSTIGLEHNAHNQYLQTWMESGILGLIAFLACVTIGLFSMHKNSSYVSFILIFSLMCLTESIGERQKGVVFFTLFQVLFLGLETSKE